MLLETQTNQFVPEDITKKYLERYTPAEREMIENLYQEISANAFADYSDAPKSGASEFVLIAGAQGAGKSGLKKRILKEKGVPFINADVDNILKSIPAVTQDLEEVGRALHLTAEFGGYDSSTHYTKAETAITKWRGAAEYMRDRLATEAQNNGYNVIMQVSGKSTGAAKLIDALNARGANPEVHICVSPVTVALQGAKSLQHGLAYPESVIRSEHESVRTNIPALMKSAKDNTTLWYRGKSDAPAVEALTLQNGKAVIGDAADAFDAHFADTSWKHSVDGLIVSALGRQALLQQSPSFTSRRSPEIA